MPPSDRNGAPDLSALYQDIILDHYRRPRNSGRLESPDERITRKNPFCGDVIELQLSFDGDRVSEARFTGQGCAISQASASMMAHLVEGKSVAELEKLAADFTQLVSEGQAAGSDSSLGELRAFSGVARLPNRHLCALLPWGALTEALVHKRRGQVLNVERTQQ
ncbi:MAG TPA: SUF system NifU family Fe-S cluster assembly protein [Gemmatimonadaceae bacterium]